MYREKFHLIIEFERVRLLVTKTNLSIVLTCGRAPRDADHRISAGLYTSLMVNELVNVPRSLYMSRCITYLSQFIEL